MAADLNKYTRQAVAAYMGNKIPWYLADIERHTFPV